MSALAVLALALALQGPPVPASALEEPAREIFRLERESNDAATAPDDAAHAATAGEPQPSVFDPMTGPALRNDAWLHDVCFIDARHGWAAGDRGVIWHTDDGGRTWQLQASGVACPLRSICFLNEQKGWAAGGFSHPYTHTSAGVVLLTLDGGRHWYHDPHLLLPALGQLRFFDERQGWAVGNRSAMFPAGVFLTRDGGRTWMPLGGGAAAGWTTAAFLDPHLGLLAGRNGSVAAIRQGEFEPVRMGDSLQSFRQLKFITPPYAWLVGDGGAVLFSADLGAHWQPPPAFPRDTAALLDFAALAVRGPRCWIAGTPGSRVLHSADGGRTWTALATPTPLPLESLAFPDDLHGWAVGALGTILATADGGQTWRQQRAGGTRAALLALFGQEDHVPLELLARLAGNEGYLSVVDVLGRRDVELPSPVESPRADRLHEAVVSVGGCGAETAWQFPLRQASLQFTAQQILAGWDRLHAGRGLDALEAHLVRQIRLWRPEVVVTPGAAAVGDDATESLIGDAVAEAIRKAADPRAYPQQTTLTGLEPWSVKKAYAALPAGSRGTVEVIAAQWAPRLGRSLADLAAPAHGLLDDDFHAVPGTQAFRSLADAGGQEQGHGDFFAGIALGPGSDARRQLSEAPAEGIELLQRSAQRRRHVQAILDQAERDPRAAVRLLAQTGDLTRELDATSAAQVVYRLADHYAHSGHGDMAAESFQLLLDQYPNDPLCRPALIWLLQYYASGEEAERAPVAAQSGSGAKAGSRLDRAVQLATQIERTRPDLFAQPAVRFPLAAAYRNQGLPQQAQRLYAMQNRGAAGAPGAAGDAWWACAQGELWLAQPKGPGPKPSVSCVAAAVKPRLDGRLDDAVWQQAKPVALVSSLHDDAQWPAAVMLAHDAEFLYIAVSCRQAPGAHYEAAHRPRGRDSDLSAHDRVDVLIDLDRDFASYYRLTIDHRGWTHDSCRGDSSWDPTWFVAAETREGVWTAEAAIPLKQLTNRPPAAGTVWAIGLQRTVPGVGFQSWTTPAATRVVPEGFGYLTFE